MKKIYKSPKVTVIEVKTQQLLSGSEYIMMGSHYNGSATIESRRGGGFFDDDDWDE